MKRHDGIVILSREHHLGLLFCWKIRQGIKKEVPSIRIQPYVKYFLDNHLQHHFEEEETQLFIGLEEDKLVANALAEHQDIMGQIDEVLSSANLDYSMLERLANAVDAHIRFEERKLFPHLENVLDENRLVEIGKILEMSHQTVDKDEYKDEFWA